MLLDNEQILARLKAADALDPEDGGPGGEAYVEATRSIVPHAAALGDPDLLFRAILSFTWALRSKPLEKGTSDFFGEALPALRKCLLMWHAEPHLFREDLVRAMWSQLFLIVDAYVWLYPEPAPRIHRFLDELERYCPPSRQETRYAIDHYRMKVEARRGDHDAVERLWTRLRGQGRPQAHFRLQGMATHEALMWRRLGRNDRAVEALAPLATGLLADKGSGTRTRADALIMPFLCAGRVGEAVAAHQQSYKVPGMKVEDVAAHLEFCARTGNAERGLGVLRRNLRYFEKDVSSVEAMWTAAAAALLCDRAVAEGLDREWTWPCDCDDPECGEAVEWSYSELGAALRQEVTDFSRRLDELNGTSFSSEKADELMRADPIIAELPLPPDAAGTAREAPSA